METFNNLFEHKFVINLDRDFFAPGISRWKTVTEDLKKHNISACRFAAVEGYVENGLLAGEVGIFKSQYRLINTAKKLHWPSIVIFEDDVQFCEQFNEIFNQEINNIPEDWHMIYMGANHLRSLLHVNGSIYRMFHGLAVHAVIIRSTMYDSILERMKTMDVQIDVLYAELQKTHNVYCFYPCIATQRPGHSYIQGGYVDYTGIIK